MTRPRAEHYSEHLRRLLEYERLMHGGAFSRQPSHSDVDSTAFDFLYDLLKQAIRRGESITTGMALLQRWLRLAGHAEDEARRWRRVLKVRWAMTLLLVALFLGSHWIKSVASWESILAQSVLLLWAVLGFKMGFSRVPDFWGSRNFSEVREWGLLVFGQGAGPHAIRSQVQQLRQETSRSGAPLRVQLQHIAEGYLRDKLMEWKSALREFEDRLPLIELLGLGLPAILMLLVESGLLGASAKG